MTSKYLAKVSQLASYFQTKLRFKTADSYVDPQVVEMVKRVINQLKSNPAMKSILDPQGIEVQRFMEKVNVSFVLDFDADDANQVYSTENTRKSLIKSALIPVLEKYFEQDTTLTWTENPYREY